MTEHWLLWSDCESYSQNLNKYPYSNLCTALNPNKIYSTSKTTQGSAKHICSLYVWIINNRLQLSLFLFWGHLQMSTWNYSPRKRSYVENIFLRKRKRKNEVKTLRIIHAKLKINDSDVDPPKSSKRSALGLLY